MGYKRKVLHITFEDTPELEVYVRSLSVRRALSLMRTFGDLKVEDFASMPDDQAEALLGPFVDRVVSWSLEEDDGTPVPVTLDALMDWDIDEAFKMLIAWMQRATSIAVPTTAPAAGTGTVDPVEMTIPMASPGGT